MTTAAIETKPGLLRKLGVAGFLFFLIKGILWLMLPAVVAWFM